MSLDRTLLPPARVLLSLIFIVSGVMKLTQWSATARFMAAHGLPMVQLLLLGAVVVELLGGLSVMLGVWPRHGAIALFAYLIPVTLVFHAFWRLTGIDAQRQGLNFLKNLSIMGGLLVVAATAPSVARTARSASREGREGRGPELPSTHSTSTA